MNLAEALNANPSASGSSDDNVVQKAKSDDDDLNANMSDITKRFNAIDLSYRHKVITQESSSDFIDDDHAEDAQHLIPDAVRHEKEVPTKMGSSVKGEMGLKDDHANNDNPDELVMLQFDDKDWKKEVGGSSYNRGAGGVGLLDVHKKTDPKNYAHAKKEESEVENIQVLPEVINCPKCNRKVATGAINYHVKFCNPDHIQ